MMQFLVVLFVLAFIVAIFDWVFSVAIPVVIAYILLPIVGFFVIKYLYRFIKHLYNYFFIKSDNNYTSFQKVNSAHDDLKTWSEKEQEAIQKYKKRKEKRKKVTEEWDRAAKERERVRINHRDSNYQTEPYTYEIGIHGNESLAIRYGIANQEKKIKKYYYFEKGGVKKHNKDRDEVYYVPSNKIRIQKNKRIKNDLYEVSLSDYRNRVAMAVIEKGTEYVKTFYPIDENWFNQHEELELTLKGNGTFSLKELATFHVNKTINNK
jgi:hypothetical protein